jgi:biopolymer transport protein ExbB
LFESIQKPLDPPEEKTALDTLEAGGTIAYVIVVLGFLAILLMFVRLAMLFRFNTPTGFVASIEQAVAKSRTDALKLAKSSRGLTAVAVAKLLERDKPAIEDIDEIVAGLAPRAERFNTILMVIAAIAPLLGLLGTVTGMIATFDIITEFGTGDPKLLSAGISEALITTKLGLMVAIPTLVVGNVLRAWGDRIIGDIDHGCLVARGSGAATPTESQEEVARAVVLSQIGGGNRMEAMS